MRARAPDLDGYVEREGVSLFFEVYGEGKPTLLLLPAWSIVHSRHWKAQIPYLARHFRVVTFDGRGNGRSGRPSGADSYLDTVFAADASAVLDHLGAERVVLVSLSRGVYWALLLAATDPDRYLGIVALAPAVFVDESDDDPNLFFDPPKDTKGWGKFNQHHWRSDQRDFVEFFFGEACSESHSTKQIEDCVGWGLETTPEVLIDTTIAEMRCEQPETDEKLRRVRCPVLVIHGTDDRIVPLADGERLAAVTGGDLITLVGAGHMLHCRHPVQINLLIREFVEGVAAAESRR
jgi:pimeloyl-ACP methyl ester carboxylesterase